MAILHKKQNIITEGEMYSLQGIKSQILFEEKRGFIDSNESEKIPTLFSSKNGESISFLLNGKVRVEFQKISDNIFKVITQNTNGELNNPRNNPTPGGAYDQDFGRQFMSTGGNSIPKANTPLRMKNAFSKYF